MTLPDFTGEGEGQLYRVDTASSGSRTFRRLLLGLGIAA
jgi:hypothetical protein